MKKIGIMTFHASYNCGSILQTMALQNVLNKKYNIENEVINFSNENQRKLYSVFYKQLNAKNIIKNILCIPGRKAIAKHYKEYSEYIPSHIKMSKNFYGTEKELHGIEKDYDGFICGSDQVWNVNCDDGDKAYYLSFVEKKPKIAYAPSLGAINIMETDKKDEYKEYLKDYVALSTREDNGSKWISELTGRDVPVVLDPTLLINEDEWEKKIDFEPDAPKEDYIFYYAFGYNDENNYKIDEIAQKLNLKVVIIDSKQWYIKRLYRFKSFYLSKNTGPNAYLYFIKKSKYVVTASFHGSAFSIIFHKQFIYLKGAKHNPKDDRSSGLLKKMHLEERLITVDKLNEKILRKEIDYKEVDKSKKKLQEKSYKYLEDALTKADLL